LREEAAWLTLPGMRYLLLAALVLGCARHVWVGRTLYKPIGQKGDQYGYAEMQMNDRQIEVSFTAKAPAEARTGAMWRAAELALERGADGFTIVSEEDLVEAQLRRRHIVRYVIRGVPVTVLTISLLRRHEFESVPSDVIVYDAHLVAPRR
jgi:hypothetical protein